MFYFQALLLGVIAEGNLQIPLMILPIVVLLNDRPPTRLEVLWNRWVVVVAILHHSVVLQTGREHHRLGKEDVHHLSVIEIHRTVIRKRVVRLEKDRLVVVRYEVRLQLTVTWNCHRAWYVFINHLCLHNFSI